MVEVFVKTKVRSCTHCFIYLSKNVAVIDDVIYECSKFLDSDWIIILSTILYNETVSSCYSDPKKIMFHIYIRMSMMVMTCCIVSKLRGHRYRKKYFEPLHIDQIIQFLDL